MSPSFLSFSQRSRQIQWCRLVAPERFDRCVCWGGGALGGGADLMGLWPTQGPGSGKLAEEMALGVNREFPNGGGCRSMGRTDP